MLNSVVHGGQGVLSNIRRLTKSTLKVFLFSVLMGLLVSITYVWKITPYHAITDTLSLQEAKLRYDGWSKLHRLPSFIFNKYFLDDDYVLISYAEQNRLTQTYQSSTGRKFSAKTIDILDNEGVHFNKKLFSYNISKGFQYGIYSMFLFFLLIISIWIYLSKKKSNEKHLRGAWIVSPKRLKKILRWKFKASKFRLAGVPLLKKSETKHFLFTGTTGSGKSIAIHELLQQVREKKQRCVVIDTTGDLVKHFYRKDQDILLNPFDKRCVPWTFWGECLQEPHYEEAAASVVKVPSHAESMWAENARIVIAELLRKMNRENNRTNKALTYHVFKQKIKDLETFLEDTNAARLVDDEAKKMTLSFLVQCVAPLQIVQYLPDSDSPFSIRKWVKENKTDQWLFITCKGGGHNALMKPVLAFWLESAVSGLLALEENKKRRLWFVIDELFNLGRVTSFPTLLDLGRKYGACGLAAFQSMPKLEEIYGEKGARSLINCFNTKIIFRNSEPNTCEYLSKLLGESEIIEAQENHSYGDGGSSGNANYYFQTKMKRLVIPSELQMLDDLRGYLQFPGNYPVTKLKFKVKKYDKLATDFDLIDNIDIKASEVNIQLPKNKLQQEKKDTTVEVASYYIHSGKLIVMLSNQEKIEIGLKSIPSLAGSDESEVSKVSLSDDKQSFIWKKLGVMINVNNLDMHLGNLNEAITVEEYYFNNGLLIVELNNKKIIMISLDQLQSKAVHSGANDSFSSDTYIYENIRLSKDKRSFSWPNLNIVVDIGEIEHLSVNDRYSAIDESKRLSND